MPYENERANPSGHASVASSKTVMNRLSTFAGFSRQRDEDIAETLTIENAANLHSDVKSSELSHVIAIDGSFQAVENKDPDLEVGFIKIGVVAENLIKLRKLEMGGPISPKAFEECYKNYAIECVLPGYGVIDKNTKESGVDKLRLEIYETMKLLDVDPLKVFKKDPAQRSLFDVFTKLTQSGAMDVLCPTCHKASHVGEYPIRCVHCGASMLYSTDALRMHEILLKGTASVYGEAMSTFERLLMAGLLFKASYKEDGTPKKDDSFKRTAFITDGPLALFRSGPIAPLLLEQIQDLPTPMLAGFEKTGQFVDYANSKTLQEILEPGHVVMITNKTANMITRRNTDAAYGSQSFYGRRFFYRTLSGDKTFVFALPPRVGGPSDGDDSWDNYPTLKTFCELIEETQTNAFGMHSAAISSIAKANDASSIPKYLGHTIFEDVLREAVGE